MKRICIAVIFTSLLWVTNVNASSNWSCYGNPWGYVMGGLVAGMVILEAVDRYQRNQIPPDRSGYCPDERYPNGQVVGSPVQQPQQRRYFKKVWIPGSLQLQCSKGYYNFFGNFVPPDCQRIWVPGYWELR
jgi:hypothetical protein